MKAKSAPNKHCRGCKLLWTKGIKDGKHNIWCCKFGKPAKDTINHCKNVKGKEL